MSESVREPQPSEEYFLQQKEYYTSNMRALFQSFRRGTATDAAERNLSRHFMTLMFNILRQDCTSDQIHQDMTAFSESFRIVREEYEDYEKGKKHKPHFPDYKTLCRVHREKEMFERLCPESTFVIFALFAYMIPKDNPFTSVFEEILYKAQTQVAFDRCEVLCTYMAHNMLKGESALAHNLFVTLMHYYVLGVNPPPHVHEFYTKVQHAYWGYSGWFQKWGIKDERLYADKGHWIDAALDKTSFLLGIQDYYMSMSVPQAFEVFALQRTMTDEQRDRFHLMVLSDRLKSNYIEEQEFQLGTQKVSQQDLASLGITLEEAVGIIVLGIIPRSDLASVTIGFGRELARISKDLFAEAIFESLTTNPYLITSIEVTLAKVVTKRIGINLAFIGESFLTENTGRLATDVEAKRDDFMNLSSDLEILCRNLAIEYAKRMGKHVIGIVVGNKYKAIELVPLEFDGDTFFSATLAFPWYRRENRRKTRMISQIELPSFLFCSAIILPEDEKKRKELIPWWEPLFFDLYREFFETEGIGRIIEEIKYYVRGNFRKTLAPVGGDTIFIPQKYGIHHLLGLRQIHFQPRAGNVMGINVKYDNATARFVSDYGMNIYMQGELDAVDAVHPNNKIDTVLIQDPFALYWHYVILLGSLRLILNWRIEDIAEIKPRPELLRPEGHKIDIPTRGSVVNLRRSDQDRTVFYTDKQAELVMEHYGIDLRALNISLGTWDDALQRGWTTFRKPHDAPRKFSNPFEWDIL